MLLDKFLGYEEIGMIPVLERKKEWGERELKPKLVSWLQKQEEEDIHKKIMEVQPTRFASLNVGPEEVGVKRERSRLE